MPFSPQILEKTREKTREKRETLIMPNPKITIVWLVKLPGVTTKRIEWQMAKLKKIWAIGISNPSIAIEQITYLLFMKQLDKLDSDQR